MTDKELIQGIIAFAEGAEDLDEFEEKFVLSIKDQNARWDWWLSDKQRPCAERLLAKLEGQAPDVRVIPPPGTERYFRRAPRLD